MTMLDPGLVEYLADPYIFIPGLRFPDTQGRVVPFNDPHEEQIVALDDFIAPGVETVAHVKPRQIGDTTILTAAWFWIVYTSPDALRCLILANDEGAAKNIFAMIRAYNDSLPQALRRRTISDSVGELIYRDTRAGFKVLVAGGRGQGRSFTFQLLVAEEMAYWPGGTVKDGLADQVWASVTSTQHEGPNKRTAMISTPKAKGDLHERKMRATLQAWRNRDPKVRFRFFRWFDHRKYRLQAPREWEPTQEEWAHGERFGLDIDQLYWRNQKIMGPLGIGLDRFRKEYPATLEDGYRIVSGAWFDQDKLEALEASLAPRQGPITIYRRPEPGRLYAAGTDPAWCNGGDEFVTIICDDLGRQCAVFATNLGGVTMAAVTSAMLLKKYDALTLLEANPGGGGENVLREYRSRHVRLLLDGKPGAKKAFQTTGSTRPGLLADLRVDFNDKDALDLTDLATVQEMTHFRDENGRIEGGRPEGQDGVGDNRVMALALCNRARRKLPRTIREPARSSSRQAPAVNPWTAVNRQREAGR